MYILNQCKITFLTVYNLLVFGGSNNLPINLFARGNSPIKLSKFLEKLKMVFLVHILFQKYWWPVSFEDKPFYPPPLFLCLKSFMPGGNKISDTLEHTRRFLPTVLFIELSYELLSYCISMICLSIYDLSLPRGMKGLWNFFFDRSPSRKLDFNFFSVIQGVLF